MQIIKNRAIINNAWRLEDDAGDGDGAHVILPLARWLKVRAAPPAAHIGVQLKPDDEVESIADDINRIELIALEFGAFTEGRGYSQAAQLRRQYHFAGEIRALGAHRDNLPLMERCGIDAYQLAAGEDLDAALLSFDEITAYHPCGYVTQKYDKRRLTKHYREVEPSE